MDALDQLEERAARERDALKDTLVVLSQRLTPEAMAQEALQTAIGTVAGRVSAHRGNRAGSAAEAAVPLAGAVLGQMRRASRTPPMADAARGAGSGPDADIRTHAHPITTRKGDVRMSDHNHTGPQSRVASGVSHATETAGASLEALRARIDHGLEDLPQEARQRVRCAREAAMEAAAEVDTKTRMAADAARSTARDNPLLVGALAFAAGAALAAALPRSSIENRTVGARRDQLFDEAERIYREERAKLAEAANEALEAGRQGVEAAFEKGQEPPPTAA
jgi:hypothetical protein